MIFNRANFYYKNLLKMQKQNKGVILTPLQSLKNSLCLVAILNSRISNSHKVVSLDCHAVLRSCRRSHTRA